MSIRVRSAGVHSGRAPQPENTGLHLDARTHRDGALSRRLLVLVVLAGLALLATAPGAGAAQPAGVSNADLAAARTAAAGLALSSGALLMRPRATLTGYRPTVSGQDADKLAGPYSYNLVSNVLPRDGDNRGQAPPTHDDAWIALVILAGLLVMSGAGYLLYARREAA
ncbi:hypothetical protein [Amycolatopsis saalfeldensis]|nr:hypothetical protein [Amycolatopsis saalfeldensis]